MNILKRKSPSVDINEPKPPKTQRSKQTESWITEKILNTVPGCALCSWCTTMFIDVFVLHEFVKTESSRREMILILGGGICLGLAIYRYFREIQTERTWIAIFGNAFLIYLNALGYQVGSKEMALRLYGTQIKSTPNMVVVRPNLAGFNVLYPLITQTTWLPDKNLTDKIEQLQADKVAITAALNEAVKDRLDKNPKVLDVMKMKDLENQLLEQKQYNLDLANRIDKLINQNTALGSTRRTTARRPSTVPSYNPYPSDNELKILELRDSLELSRNLLKKAYEITKLMELEIVGLNDSLNMFKTSINKPLDYRAQALEKQNSDLRQRIKRFDDMLNTFNTKLIFQNRNSIYDVIDKYMGAGFGKKLLTPIGTY